MIRGWFSTSLVLAVTASAAVAIDVPLPSSPEVTVTSAAPQPTTVAAAPVAAAAIATASSQTLGSRTLRVGMKGSDVKAFQRILRKRGYAVVADGAFGPKTQKAVKALQRKLKLRPTGVVRPSLLSRLGVDVRVVKGDPTPAPVAPAGDYPLAGPNAASAKYLKVFPVAGKHTYSNDFGAPRSQGGHQGNDIMAERGVPLRAVRDGSIKRLTRTETGLGGLWIWLEDTDGNDYYYAHMDSVAADLQAGTTVTAGQVVGTVGNTGDARYGATHLHFEIHPGGGGAVNPNTDLLAVDPEPPVR